MKRPPLPVLVLFAIALAAFGIMTAVYFFAGDATYRDLSRGRGTATFVNATDVWVVDEATLADLHVRTLSYVLDAAAELPRMPDGSPLYGVDESAHLEDVRVLFRALRIAWIAGGLVVLGLLIAARGRPFGIRMVRDGALLAAGSIVVVSAIFAVAYEPTFLAFHEVFFPQGNFLFDPDTSNMLELYPDEYWYGVTLRVGIAFIVAAVLLALGAELLRRSATNYRGRGPEPHAPA